MKALIEKIKAFAQTRDGKFATTGFVIGFILGLAL